MSWKLAELRWRHDVGLQESARGCHNDNSQRFESQEAEGRSQKPRRQRSRTTSSDWLDGEGFQKACDGQLSPSLSPEPIERIQSYLDSALLRNPPISSTTPLLTPSHRLQSTDVTTGNMVPPQSDDFQGGPCLPTSPPAPAATKSASCTGYERGESPSRSGDVHPSRTDDNPLHLSDRRVSGDTSAAGNKQEIIKPPGQSLEPYVLDNDSLDLFSISESPAFGLHFDVPPSDDERHPAATSSSHSGEYTSFPTCFRRAPIESKHHSDSCLLEKCKSEDSETSFSFHSQTMRTLYPDLRSAHAQIQGRREASQTRSAGFEPRFPLSRSSSSSEDDDYFTKVLPFSDANTPLRDLVCHRVPSGLGILQVAQDHLESSAILESIEDNTARKPDDRLSYTVDDIISHYVDLPTGPFTRHGSSKDDFRPATPGSHAWDANSRTAQCDKSNTKAGAVVCTSVEDLVNDSVSGPPDMPTQGSSVDQFRRLEAPEVDDCEWPTFPESSRSGFLNPSGLRFRLTKKETGDVARASAISRKSPATPWDPLPTTHRRRGQRGLYRKTHSRIDQSHTSPQQPAYPSRDTFVGHKGTQRIRRRSFPASAEKRRCQPLKLLDLAHASNERPQNSQTTVHASAENVNVPHIAANTSSSPSALTSLNVIDRALPSSSLLPKCSKQDSWLTLPLSGSINISTNSVPVPCARANVSDTVSGTGSSNNGPRSGDSSEILISERDRPTISGLINMITDAMDANELEGTFQRPFRSDKTQSVAQQVYSNPDCNGLPDENFVQSLDCTNDVDGSHSIRDSQRLQRGPFSKGKITNAILKRTGIGRAGSSLADCSSSALQLCNSEDSGCQASLGCQSNAEDTFRFTDLSDALKNTQASSAFPECTFSSRFTDVTLSTFESSAELKAHCARRDVLIDMGHCPTFPLTPGQLSIARLDGTNRIPFERLQVLKSGEWLEKAWCFVHNRAEFSHTRLAKKMTSIVASDAMETQREAGRFLLLISAATYIVGGFVLAHDMGKEGILSTSAMATLTNGVASRVHPRDVRWAQAIVKGGLVLVFCVLVGCVGVLVWTLA